MSISEACRMYAKVAKPKSYAEAARPSTEPLSNAMHVTKTDLEYTLEFFFSTYSRIYFLNNAAANLFVQAVQVFIISITTTYTAMIQTTVPAKETAIPPVTQENK